MKMKKIILIGIICIVIGGVFCGAAYAFGERYVSSNLTDTSVSFASDGVSKIDISEHVAKINFIKKNDGTDDITVKAENILESEFKCSLIDGATLQIAYNPNKVKIGFISLPAGIFSFGNKSAVINVYIPDAHVFDEVYFNGGVGEVEIEDMTVKNFTVSGGVGSYNIKEITVTEGGKLYIDCGVGEMKINGSIFGDAELQGGVGEIKMSGQINGDIKLSTGVGSVDLDLKGNIGDYNIKADKGLGSIKLNGSNISDSSQNGGKYNIDIDAGVGSININIK